MKFIFPASNELGRIRRDTSIDELPAEIIDLKVKSSQEKVDF
jgi:hypothetical protein